MLLKLILSYPRLFLSTDGRARFTSPQWHLSERVWHSYFALEGVTVCGVYWATSVFLVEGGYDMRVAVVCCAGSCPSTWGQACMDWVDLQLRWADCMGSSLGCGPCHTAQHLSEVWWWADRRASGLHSPGWPSSSEVEAGRWMCVGLCSWRASWQFQSCYECYDGCAQAV